MVRWWRDARQRGYYEGEDRHLLSSYNHFDGRKTTATGSSRFYFILFFKQFLSFVFFGSGYSCCCRNLEEAFISTQPHSPWRLQPSAHCLLLKCTSAALFSLTPTLLENASILLVPTGTFDLLFLVFFRRFVFLWSRENIFDCRLVHFLFLIIIFLLCVSILMCFAFLFTIGYDPKRSTEWRHNTILTNEAVECLESSEQRQYDRG